MFAADYLPCCDLPDFSIYRMISRIVTVISFALIFVGVDAFTVAPSSHKSVRNWALSMTSSDGTVEMGDVGFVLLAGGTGSRMKANMPKQFLELRGVPVLHHSLDLFLERLPAHAAETGVR